jgi:hypothetical protein
MTWGSKQNTKWNTKTCDKAHSTVWPGTSINRIGSRLRQVTVLGQLPQAGDRTDANVLQVRSWRLKGTLWP